MYKLIFWALWALAYVVSAMLDQPRRMRDRERTLKWMSRRLGGAFIPNSRDRVPAISWDVEKTAVMLCPVENRRGDLQGFALRIGQACQFHLRLLPETGWARVRRFFGAQDLQTGDAAFDRRFLVQADLPGRALPLLAPEVRAALTGLARLGPISLEAGPSAVVLRTTERFDGELERLTTFAREAVEVARSLLRILDPAVLSAEVVTSVGACPVCSTPVEDDRGICARCRTPHHKDCWNYLGGCAIFGCAGRPSRLRSLPERGRLAQAGTISRNASRAGPV